MPQARPTASAPDSVAASAVVSDPALHALSPLDGRYAPKLDALREEMSAAQAQLEAIKSGQAPRTTGAFSLLKQVVDAQKAIDALLVEHPGLRQ